MNAKKIILSALCSMLTIAAYAEARSEAEMLQIASKALCAGGMRRAPSRNGNLSVLRTTEQLCCIGNPTGGFVVLANDDSFEPVLAIVDQPYSDEAQPAFEWWLRAAEEALTLHSCQIRGVSEQYPTSVEPLIKTTWGQREPFYNQDVIEANGSNYQMLTGCVATAMAQVIKYYGYPEHGVGRHRYSTRYSNIGTVYHEVNYASHTYDYPNMLLSYADGYNDAEATAVATLMRDCGVAVDMVYNGTGSSSSSVNVPQALRTHFGYNPYVRHLQRNRFSDDKWIDMIHEELAAGRPIMYGGQDPTSGGHEFLLDGYNEQGLVHVNWGWAGLYDGWFDLSVLQPDESNYSEGQDMVIGLQPAPEQLRSRIVHVGEAGTLHSLISDQEKYSLQSLTLTGNINSSDIAFIREMMGLSATAETEGLLTAIDLSGCNIVAGGSAFWSGYGTTNAVLPQYLFTHIGSDGYGVTTSGLSHFAMPNNTQVVGRYSLFSCPAITELVIPASVQQLENEVSINAYNLHAMYFLSPTPPAATSPLTKLNLGECTLYVPQGARNTYLDAAYWMTFGNVVEIASPYCQLDLVPSDPAKGSIEGGGSYLYGQTVCIKATGKSGYKFDKWSDGDRHRVRQLTLSGNLALTASFTRGSEDTALEDVFSEDELNPNAPMYNIFGLPVDADYDGIIIQNGKKYIQIK